MPFVAPPVWPETRLEADRKKAIDNFVKTRRKESQTLYGYEWTNARRRVAELFTLTSDLTDLDPDAFLPDDTTSEGTDRNGHQRIIAYRFLTGVPVSADDLRTMVGNRLGRRILSTGVRQAIMDAVEPEIDRIRVPWIDEGRDPTSEERQRAIDWTAGLIAMERRRTARRTRASNLQESCVAKLLQHVGFKAGNPKEIGEISLASDLPKGEYLRETRAAGAKCDVPVRLRDGRLMTIECKSSNSAVNSVKRISRETVGKSKSWQAYFGVQVVTTAVISGVYELPTLVNAQSEGVALFWQHDLGELISFLEKTT